MGGEEGTSGVIGDIVAAQVASSRFVHRFCWGCGGEGDTKGRLGTLGRPTGGPQILRATRLCQCDPHGPYDQ